MKDRIKKVRIDAGLSQQKFADALRVPFANIQGYEYGKRNPSDAFIQLLANKYNVDEHWLRTGEGEPYPPKDRMTEIAEVTASLMKSEEPLRLKIAKLLASLTDEQIAELRAIMEELVANEESHPE